MRQDGDSCSENAVILETLVPLIANVEMMAGDALSELLAPSEIVAIAEALVAAGLTGEAGAQAFPNRFPSHLAWMASVPASMHDCFNG